MGNDINATKRSPLREFLRRVLTILLTISMVSMNSPLSYATEISEAQPQQENNVEVEATGDTADPEEEVLAQEEPAEPEPEELPAEEAEHIFEELNRITNTNFTDNKLELEII